MVGQQDAGNHSARTWMGCAGPRRVWTAGDRGRVGGDGDSQRQPREACADPVAGGQTPHPEKRVGEFEHDHDGTAIVSRGIFFRHAVMFVIFVAVLRVGRPIIDFVDRDTVRMKVVAVVVVDQDRVRAERTQDDGGEEGRPKQQSRRTLDKQTHDITRLIQTARRLPYRNAPMQPANELGILPRVHLDIQVTFLQQL